MRTWVGVAIIFELVSVIIFTCITFFVVVTVAASDSVGDGEISPAAVASMLPTSDVVFDDNEILVDSKSLMIITHATEFYDRNRAAENGVKQSATSAHLKKVPLIFVIDEPVQHIRRNTIRPALDAALGMYKREFHRQFRTEEYLNSYGVKHINQTLSYLPNIDPYRFVVSGGDLNVNFKGSRLIFAGGDLNACLGGSIYSITKKYFERIDARSLRVDLVEDGIYTRCSTDSDRVSTLKFCEQNAPGFILNTFAANLEQISGAVVKIKRGEITLYSGSHISKRVINIQLINSNSI